MKNKTVEKAAWILMALAVICLILRDEDIPLSRWFFLGSGVLLAASLGYYALTKKKTCPKCGSELPKWRIPKDRYEMFSGGWTCPNCGTRLTWKLRERK